MPEVIAFDRVLAGDYRRKFLNDVSCLVSVISNFAREQISTGKLTADQQHQALESIERLPRLRLHFVYGSGYTSSDVNAYARPVQTSEPASRR